MVFRWNHVTGHIQQQEIGGTRNRLSIHTWSDEKSATQALDSGLLDMSKAWHPWTEQNPE
jgi:hypothetical protein